MNVAVLEGVNLKKYYGRVHALDDVSFAIEGSELLAVIGPSGSGKTTLLRSIAGFVKLDAGRIYLHGQDITDLAPEKRNVAMFFQNYALWPHMSVFENIAYGLKIKKVDKAKIREKVEWALEFLGLEGLADRKPSQLSGGQQQRVALARAIVVEPKVLLLDEPLSNLDAKIRLRIRFELKALQQKLKIPTLYVTHDQEEALSIADRVIIMHNGKVLQSGSPEEIYRNPNNLFVADFVGMNTIVKVPVENGVVKIGNITKQASTQQKTASVVVRADEVILSTNVNAGAEPEDLALTGVVKDRLYLGSKYRYEIEVEGIDEPLFVNHESSVNPGERVKIIVPKGSYFIF